MKRAEMRENEKAQHARCAEIRQRLTAAGLVNADGVPLQFRLAFNTYPTHRDGECSLTLEDMLVLLRTLAGKEG